MNDKLIRYNPKQQFFLLIFQEKEPFASKVRTNIYENFYLLITFTQ